MTITNGGDTSSSSSSLTSVAALRVIEPPTDEQTPYIQMWHNAIVGYNSADRTLTRLLSLNQVWKNMKRHVHSFIRNCPCCQKLSTIDAKINAAHFRHMQFSIHLILTTLALSLIKGIFSSPDVQKCSSVRMLMLNQQLKACYNILVDSVCQIWSWRSHFANDLIKEFLNLTGTSHILT